MDALVRTDLYSLEKYSDIRKDFRANVMAHKKNRQLKIGQHMTLYFEDRLTIHYQIQEMLRIERIFEAEAIEEELNAYNPLIPDGSNWKATMMIEYEEPAERARCLAQMVGVEDKIWLQVDGNKKIYAVADEDLERTKTDKTSAVHFLRFELNPADDITALKDGANIAAGVEHQAYNYSLDAIPENIRASLMNDLD